MTTKKKIFINSKSSKYSVHFISNFKKNFKKNFNKNDLVIIDKRILKIYRLEKLLSKNKLISINATEHQKSFNSLSSIISKTISLNFKRGNKIIAIGGGITQDISSFLASIIFRGVEWEFYPTSFLSQCDSCIGGKTSINFKKNKNQIGNFYPPKRIYIDHSFLNTLNDKQVRSGVGEMSHYFFLSSQKDFIYFKKNYLKCLKLDKVSIRNLIERSLTIKKFFIEIDEFDKKERLVLNYGHTFGHAIESLTNYAVPHGIAVAHGMNIANYISLNFGILSTHDYLEMNIILNNIWGRYKPNKIGSNAFVSTLKKDKKNINNNLRLILTKGIGRMFIKEFKIDDNFKFLIKKYINKFF